jgi:hypothetical protein
MNTNEMSSMPELAPNPEFGDLIVTARQRVIAGALAVDESKSRMPISAPLVGMAIEQTMDQARNDYGLAA